MTSPLIAGTRRCGVRLAPFRSITYKKKQLRLNRAPAVNRHRREKESDRHRSKRLVNSKFAQPNSWPWAGLILGGSASERKTGVRRGLITVVENQKIKLTRP